MKRLLPAFAVLALTANRCKAAQPTNHGLPNFGWIDKDQSIARGGQPTAEGFASLSAMGISNIVKLNLGADKVPRGTRVKNFPINFWQQLFGGKRLASKLDSAAANITPGTYVHCSHGANRTGAAIIRYRMTVSGWKKPQAISEANRYDWQSSLPGLVGYVKHQP